jgi:hypothetical protein
MKNLRYLVLAALATPALAADPEALKQYQQLRQAYYQFDPQAYQSFTCHVKVSTLDAVVASLKQIIAAHPGTLQVKDELAGYALTVDSKTGLSLHDPSLDIQVLDDKGMADPAKVRLGIAQTKQGFDTQVQGTDQIITGIFNAYLDTAPDLTSVTRDGSRWIVKYVQGGFATTDTIDGSKMHEAAAANGVSIVSDSNFAPVGGNKLGLQASAIQVSQGPQTQATSMTVSYPKLGALQVPAAIVTKTTATTPGLGQTIVAVTISFQNCAIKD